MTRQLYWPHILSVDYIWVWVGVGGIVVGSLGSYFCVPLALVPLGIVSVVYGLREVKNHEEHNTLAREQRKLSMDTTHSLLMSRAEYVGGHPIVPEAGPIVLGLSAHQLTIYSLSSDHAIQPVVSIPLEKVVQAGMGRPKSAREVYDEDYGYTIDVFEHSPFLSVTFRLEEETYRASFQSFESEMPQKWYNQITTLRHQLLQQSTGKKTAERGDSIEDEHATEGY